MLLRNVWRFGVIGLLLAVASNPASSREGETSMLVIRVAMSPELSIRDQHIDLTILKSFVLSANRLPDVAPCKLSLPFQIEYVFGEFAVTVRHPNPAMHVKCLRGVIRCLLREDLAEADFVAARAFEARIAPEWIKPDPNDPIRAEEAAIRLAFLAIYRKNSPLHQLHSVDMDAIAARSFDDFALWMERNRREARFTFRGPRRLLEALDLPVPDPMVVETVPSLASPRMPAGDLNFDGESVKVPALVMLFFGRDGTKFLDAKMKQRFVCNEKGKPDLGSGFGAIALASCQSSNDFGDVWLILTLRKDEHAGSSEFCRQVRELSRDADIVSPPRVSARMDRKACTSCCLRRAKRRNSHPMRSSLQHPAMTRRIKGHCHADRAI